MPLVGALKVATFFLFLVFPSFFFFFSFSAFCVVVSCLGLLRTQNLGEAPTPGLISSRWMPGSPAVAERLNIEPAV